MAGLCKVIRVVSSEFGELPIQAKGGTFKPSGWKRETKDGEQPENTSFTETPTHAVLKLKLNASVDAQSFTTAQDLLTIYTANGGQYTMPNAWTVDMGEVGDGEFDIEYNSAKSQKLA
ncbi:MAG: phage tail tube protein [Treponema sp.]|nr:phage tail tube protein [Treponema sp.]MBQ9623066.1 phage tail tube protein [Treponema sp.]MBR0098912.1 phage tail tube protein [Treponema sp.]